MKKYSVRELTVGSILTLFIQATGSEDAMNTLIEELGVDFFYQMRDIEQTDENNEIAGEVIIDLFEKLKNGEFA